MLGRCSGKAQRNSAVIEVRIYLSANPSDLGNYMSADTLASSRSSPRSPRWSPSESVGRNR
jgi:hypothetical protein